MWRAAFEVAVTWQMADGRWQMATCNSQQSRDLHVGDAVIFDASTVNVISGSRLPNGR